MKHNMKYVISLVFMFLFSQNIWADPAVTIIKQANGLPVATFSPGNVEYEVSEGTCTLTVTPTQGYYVTKDFITVYSVVTGDMAQSPRRAPNLDITPIEVRNAGENTDPSGQSLYEFTMPENGSDVEVTVNFQSIVTYNLYIGSTQVTEFNANDILGDNKVTFTPANENNNNVNTLTLNGAALTVPVKVGLDNLTIDIQGTNSITTDETCLQKIDNTNPSLTFKSTSDEVGNLTLTNTDEDNYGGVNDINNVSFSKELALIMSRYGSYTSNTYYFTAGEVHNAQIVPSYGVQVGELQIYAGNADNVLKDEGSPTVVFDAANHKLTLTNANIGGFIGTSLPELIIELVGNNTLSSGSESTLQSLSSDDVVINIQSSGTTTGCLVLKMAYSDNVFVGDHVTLNVTNPLEVVSGKLYENSDNINVVTIAEPVDYELVVDNIRVVAANASNITNSLNPNNEDRPIASYDEESNTLTLDNADFNYKWTKSVAVKSNLSSLIVKFIGRNTITVGNNSHVFEFTSGGTDQPSLVLETGERYGVYGSLLVNEASSVSAISNYNIQNITAADSHDGGSGWLFAETDDNVKLWYQVAYGIIVSKGDVSVTINDNNRNNVLDDENATVKFDGHNRLVLNNANLRQIQVTGNNDLPIVDSDNKLKGLEIYLEGNSVINNPAGNALESLSTAANTLLTFYTGGDAPGTLACTSNSAVDVTNPFPGFSATFMNNLTYYAGGNNVEVKMPLKPIVDNIDTPAETEYSAVPEPEHGYNNVIVNNVLYTLNDDGTSGSPDGTNGVGGSLSLVINSEMTDLEVAASDAYVPGSPEYAEKFKGLTFMVPGGTGDITLYDVITAPGYAFHVRVGDQPAMEIVNYDTDYPKDIKVSYACSDNCYVKIYLVKISSSDNPAMIAGHRIGPKASVTGGLTGMNVTSNVVQGAQGAAATYKAMEASVMAASIKALIDVRGGYSCNDPDITDLPDNMFIDDSDPSPAPRRAAPKTILPDGLTFVDFSGTKITCMEVSRTSGAFNGVPDNVFIYMPAGNTVAADTKNVVIGSISDNIELDGSIDAQPFKAQKDFKAAKAILKREFVEAGTAPNIVRATVYLPYNIPQEEANKLGTFYEYVGVDGTTVNMNKVTDGGLKANKPYIFEAKEGGVIDPMVPVVDVKANPEETSGFKGVYERKDYESGMYCYAGENRGGYTVGQFVEMGPGSYVPPFRAYMIGSGAPSYAIAWDGVIDNFEEDPNTTAVETVKAVTSEKTSEGWWTLSGIRLTQQPQKAGLYIFNGKMVVIK